MNMKNYLIVITLLLTGFTEANAQNSALEKLPPADSTQVGPKYRYIQVLFVGKNMMKPNRVTMTVSDGRDPEKFTGSSFVVTGDDGTPVVFDGPVGGFNFLAYMGWEFVSSIPISIGSTGSQVYHHVFKQRIN